jgi:hypothetical protein
MIQQMPWADLKLADVIISNLNATPNVSDLMDMGLDIPKILERFVLKDLDWRMLDTKELTYRCNCSKERFSAALRLLGRADWRQCMKGSRQSVTTVMPPTTLANLISNLSSRAYEVADYGLLLLLSFQLASIPLMISAFAWITYYLDILTEYHSKIEELIEY